MSQSKTTLACLVLSLLSLAAALLAPPPKEDVSRIAVRQDHGGRSGTTCSSFTVPEFPDAASVGKRGGKVEGVAPSASKTRRLPLRGGSEAAPGARYGSTNSSRFAAYDVVIDSGDKPLAAYQVVITPRAAVGKVTIVGIEGGEPAAYSGAPYYDPKAIQNDRVILAAYSTKPGAELPHGETRVARVHVMLDPGAKPAEPVFTIRLEAAGTAGGERIDCSAQLSPSIEAKQGDAP